MVVPGVLPLTHEPMCSIRPFTGSKRKARALERDRRRVKALNSRLNKIKALAEMVKSEDELDFFLRDVADDATRAETKKLIEPFCRFKFRQITLADGPLEQKPIVIHHPMPGGTH